MVESAGKSAVGKKGGRPRRTFTREEIDAAADLLGRYYYPSRVVDRLSEKFPDMGRESAYKVVDAARAEAAAELTGTSSNPLVKTFMGLEAVAFGEGVKDAVRVQALNGMAKLLGMSKLVKDIQEAGGVDEFLAGVLARRAAAVSASTNGKAGGA